MTAITKPGSYQNMINCMFKIGMSVNIAKKYIAENPCTSKIVLYQEQNYDSDLIKGGKYSSKQLEVF